MCAISGRARQLQTAEYLSVAMAVGPGWHYVRLSCSELRPLYHDLTPNRLLTISMCRPPLVKQLSRGPFLKTTATQRRYELPLRRLLRHHFRILRSCDSATDAEGARTRSEE